MISFNFQELTMGQGPKFVAIFLIIIAGLVVYFALNRFFLLLHRREAISATVCKIFRRGAKILIFSLIVLFALQQMGVKVSAILTSLLAVLALVAIGFIAVWSVFSNFLCSFFIIIFTPFRIGDEIEITEVVGGPGLRGVVVDFSIMYTSILESGEMAEAEKALVRVPNNIFFQKAIRRWKGKNRISIEKYLLEKSFAKEW